MMDKRESPDDLTSKDGMVGWKQRRRKAVNDGRGGRPRGIRAL